MARALSSRARLLLLGALAAGFLLPFGGCGGSGSGTVVPNTSEHGKKNKEMEDFMKSQQGKQN
jgi:hypothetical protein